jgi:hypothetical protein
VHNYLGKFKYVLWHTTKKNPPIEFIDEGVFRSILAEVRLKLNIKLNLESDKKYILLCGPDVDSKRFIKIKNIYDIINNLTNKGYMILFKKHPRDTDPYIFPDSVMNIDTAYPVELYDINVVAAINFSGSMCITLPYFNDIAVFSDMRHIKNKKIDLPYMQILTHFIVNQYTAPIELLLNFDYDNKSPEILRDKCMELFKRHIDEIPDVENNKVIINFIKRNQKYLNRANFKTLFE